MATEVDCLDCTTSCRLLSHGNLLTKCLTKREISEEKLISYLLLSCRNFSKNLDENGRSALHMACSNSKPLVAQFLLEHGAKVDAKDSESSFTPLHRAISYACLEMIPLLKRYGAAFDIFDLDWYTPIQLISNPRMSLRQKLEFFVNVWGKNKNYNLGIGNVTIRSHPDQVKGLPCVIKATVNKYHSLFLSTSGILFGCGHSKEGRLGIGNEATLTSPQEIPVKFNHKNERILDVSAGLTHSLLLTNRSVYATGSNKYLQLGIKDVEMLTTFKEVSFDRVDVDFKNMLSIIACDYHSVVVSKNGVFVCGLNVGQFGGIQESIAVPRRLPLPLLPNIEISYASSNNACICVYLNDKKTNYFYVFYSRKMKTYKNPLNQKFIQCVISGGEMLYNSDEIVKNSSQKTLTITIMTEHKNIFIWYEDIMQFVQIHISALFTAQITSISSCGDDLMILANKHLFKASIQHKVPKMYQLESEYQEYNSKRDIAQYLCAKASIKRVQRLSNVESFCCDADGESNIAILSHVNLKPLEPAKEDFDFSELLDDIQFIDSGIMDVNIVVKQESMRVNRFLVSSRCPFLGEKIKLETKNSTLTLSDDRLTMDMFRCIMTWIYKNNLTDDDLKVFQRFTKTETASLLKNFYDVCMEWSLDGVVNSIVTSSIYTEHFKTHNIIKTTSFNWFSLDEFPEFYDITILLDENKELRCHKVVLMMRIEYFKMMFYHNWSENSTIDLRHISINFMRPIIQFAYDNDVEALKAANFTDNYMYNMCAILDQYLMENIKNIFEYMIMKKVNLRNCTEDLEFSFAYNCHLLKSFCMEFISLNLARLLEGNSLDNLDMEVLKELSLFYRKYFDFDTDSRHIITPAFDAPTEEAIDSLIGEFDYTSYSGPLQSTLKKSSRNKNKLTKSEMSRRSYEKEGMKNLRQDDVACEPSVSKSLENDKFMDKFLNEHISGNWQQMDSARKKGLTAIKVNEIMKAETVHQEPMVNLQNLRNSISEEPETEHHRSIITLADFGITTKKKTTKSSVVANTEITEIKPAWNMDNIELKPINTKEPSDPFKTSHSKKKNVVPKPTSTFTSIVRDERKDKSNFEKIKSKSLILTQIEEKAILELSQFYNIDNIYDENIKIERKVHKTNQNLSQWQHHFTN